MDENRPGPSQLPTGQETPPPTPSGEPAAAPEGAPIPGAQSPPSSDGDKPPKKLRKKQLVLLCILALLVVCAAMILLRTGRTPAVTLEPQAVDEDGAVRIDSTFLLHIGGEYTEQELRARIAADPALPYDIASGDDAGTYLLTFLRPLPAGVALEITVDDAVFPFLVENRLVVTGAFPAAGAVNVPVRSGVEFTFNTQDLSAQQLEEHFSITPAVEGEFLHEDNYYIFSPADSMEYDTLYTVELHPDLATDTGASLGEAHTFSFRTISEEVESARRLLYFPKNPVSYNTLTDETPLLQLYMDYDLIPEEGEVEIDVTVHAFPGWVEYRDAMALAAGGRNRYSSMLFSVDTGALDEHARFSLAPFPAQQLEDSYNYFYLAQFPEALPAGWYIATFTVDIPDGHTLTRQLFFQSSDLSIFYMQSEGEMLVWLNDASTGEPVEGADFAITGAYHATGTTVADGTALITTGQYTATRYDLADTAAFITVTAGERTFVDMNNNHYYGYSDASVSDDYFCYLYTDRPLYHTTDTIQAWGVVRPRIDSPRPLDDLRLELSYGAAEQAVTLQPDGTFTAAISFENVTYQDWTRLHLRAGDNTLSSTNVRITDFVKPVYTATTGTDRPVYLAGDTPVISLDVTTFDGTPVSAFPVRVSESYKLAVDDTQLLTDGQGHLQVAVGIDSDNDNDTWYPQSYYYDFYSDDAESETFSKSGRVYMIHRDVMLTGVPGAAGSHSLLVNTHAVDISSITESDQLWDRENLRGAPLSREVTAEVHKVYYTREVRGTYYDIINRVSRESYEYERRDDITETRTFTTGADGAYTLEDLPLSDEDAYYYVELSTADTAGRRVEIRAYLGSDNERNWMSMSSEHSPHYALNKVVDLGAAQAEDDQEGGVYYPSADTLRAQFQDNEAVTFRLENNDEAVEDFTGRLLYSVAQDRFTHYGQADAASFTLPYSEDLLPNYVMTGAYFDGRHVFMLEDKHMDYSPDQRQLEIALRADRPSYRPGEPVTVTADVKNAHTGQRAADTAVVLGVVDEAIFALAGQSSNILAHIYRSVFYPTLSKYASYTPGDLYENAGDYEEPPYGDDDSGMVRGNFEDTALFSTAVTDADGRAVFHFQLPDNITGWRLTSLALSPDTHAGSQVESIRATQEFFLLPVVADTILEGDSFTVGLRGSGDGVETMDPVSYTVTVEGEGVSRTLTAASTLRAYTSVRLDGLGVGDYTVTIRGVCGDYTDAVQLPFSVAASGVEVSLVQTADLRGGIDIDPLRYPVCIYFYDQSLQTYNRVLRSVYQKSGGARADMRLARRYAILELERWGDAWYNREALQEDLSDLSGQYLLRLFPYAERDLALTVKARLALPDLVGNWALKGLSVSDEQYGDDAAAVYLAQVLAGESPQADLAQLLADGHTGYVDSVYLALALALAGDEEAARDWYAGNVTPYLQQSTAVSGEVLRWVEAGDPARSDDDCTAAASMLATILETDDAEGLVLYLAEKPAVHDPYLLEQLLYLTRCRPDDGGAGASFSYIRDGEAVNLELARGARHVTFTKAQLAEADFQVLSGQVYADIYYTGTPDTAERGGRKLIGLTKTVEAVDGGEITTGSSVKITLTPDLDALDTEVGDQTILVDDYIPTGMRFERYDRPDFEDAGWGWYPASRQGQRMQFVVYRANETGDIAPIVYYARCASPGQYVVESAYASSASADVWGRSERDTVVIG